MGEPIRILIADDHALVREGTRRILEREEDLEVVGEAADGEEAVTLAERLAPDVAVIDIGMPGMNGIEATRRIKEEHPEIGVLVLTVHDEDPYVYAILETGDPRPAVSLGVPAGRGRLGRIPRPGRASRYPTEGSTWS